MRPLSRCIERIWQFLPFARGPPRCDSQPKPCIQTNFFESSRAFCVFRDERVTCGCGLISKLNNFPVQSHTIPTPYSTPTHPLQLRWSRLADTERPCHNTPIFKLPHRNPVVIFLLTPLSRHTVTSCRTMALHNRRCDMMARAAAAAAAAAATRGAAAADADAAAADRNDFPTAQEAGTLPPAVQHGGNDIHALVEPFAAHVE
jgi:hypothetical protein